MPNELNATTAATLVLVCKRPSLGHGKQRLAAQIGEPQALWVAEQLLGCALEDLRAWPGPTVIAPDMAEHLDWARALTPEALCLPQASGRALERSGSLAACRRPLPPGVHRQRRTGPAG